jgi:hypothetical protein
VGGSPNRLNDTAKESLLISILVQYNQTCDGLAMDISSHESENDQMRNLGPARYIGIAIEVEMGNHDHPCTIGRIWHPVCSH